MHELVYLGKDVHAVTKPPKPVAMPTQTRGGLVLTWSVSNLTCLFEFHVLIKYAIMIYISNVSTIYHMKLF